MTARGGRPLIVVLAVALLGVAASQLPPTLTNRRTTPVYDPPVLAGQPLWGSCSGGVYARLGDQIVVTSSGHCTTPGTVAYDPDGVTVRGTFGEPARDATCPYTGHTCASSDINYLVVAPPRIPWGHLNVIDMGWGGYRVVPARTQPLRCADIAIGDAAEINGRDIWRVGKILEKGDNLKPADADGAYFPCMVAVDIRVDTGDSGGVVLVRGIPAGATSRSFAGYLGFTPLAEGLEQLGLKLCTAPDCGLTPAVARAGG
jgi:hypothetical protein